MKPRICLWLMTAVATLTILAAGCSPTGWAVREVPDGSNLKPGEKVTVIQNDGTVMIGRYIGPATIPSAEYIMQYGRVAQSAFGERVLPAIGQTVQLTTVLSDAKSWRGQLAGFDLAHIWMRFPGQTESEPIYFSSINSLSDGNGGVIPRMMLRNLFLNGDIPLMSALKFENAAGEFSVPISSIRELVVANATVSDGATNGNALPARLLP